MSVPVWGYRYNTDPCEPKVKTRIHARNVTSRSRGQSLGLARSAVTLFYVNGTTGARRHISLKIKPLFYHFYYSLITRDLGGRPGLFLKDQKIPWSKQQETLSHTFAHIKINRLRFSKEGKLWCSKESFSTGDVVLTDCICTLSIPQSPPPHAQHQRVPQSPPLQSA